MALFTKTEAETYRDEAKTAYQAVLSGKSYEIKDRKLTRQDLSVLKKEMYKWAKYVEDIDAGLDPDSSVQTKRGFFVG